MPLQVQSNIVKFEPIKGLEHCFSFFNGVMPRIKFQEIIIVRCMENLNGQTKSTIKFILNQEVVQLNITETKEYLNWGAGGNFWWAFFGPEDPRLFEFNHELYLYYTMTNPHAKNPMRGLEFIKLSDAISGDSRGHFMQPEIFGKDANWVEKNWLFINNGTNILALYNLQPFILGEVIGDSLRARIKRDYKCMDGLNNVHFSSNAIKINNHGRIEYMFVFNEKTGNVAYNTYFAFMETKAPFNLLRISKKRFELGLPADRFTFINSITILNKAELFADKGDTILLSGGIDDTKVFVEPFKMEFFLEIEMKSCIVENSEWAYFNNVQECPSTVDFGLLISIAMFAMLAYTVYRHVKYFNSGKPKGRRPKQPLNYV